VPVAQARKFRLMLAIRYCLPVDANTSLDRAIRHGVPVEAVALYARWWQFETWLRNLTYFVLRSLWGAEWEEKVNKKARDYAANDNLVHIVSPDRSDLLTYLDFSLLVHLIDSEWDMFEPFLLSRKIWQGRCEEFKKIRNSVGHLRRPSNQNLSRVEMTLRDLEPGWKRAFTALAAEDVSRRDGDPVIDAFRRGVIREPDTYARHRYGPYAFDFTLSVSRMPWAAIPEPPAPITGTPGLIWQLSFGGPDIWVRPQDFQEHLPEAARDALVFAFMGQPFGVTLAAAAVDPSEVAIRALRDGLETFTYVARPIEKAGSADDWPGDLADLDPRILVQHPFAVAELGDIVSAFGVS
jgi:hypothetical protein